MRVYSLRDENKSKKRFIIKHPSLTPEQKEELISLYIKQNIPDDILDWHKVKNLSYTDLKEIIEKFLKERQERRTEKELSKAIEGRDYLKIFENDTNRGKEYLYLPLTWIGSKYLASDHFAPKIKVPSKVMDARDFSDNNSKNEDLSPGAKWCISLWTIPDYVVNGKVIADENGKEFRHEGKKYWLDYTSIGLYFLFYFRDNKRLKDNNKKIALTMGRGSQMREITLADDTQGKKTSAIKRIQEYWNEHYKEYEFQIKHIQEVSKEEKTEFGKYELKKRIGAIDYLNTNFLKYFIYNEETGRYDSKGNIPSYLARNFVKKGEITIPLGVINGDICLTDLKLNTLKNGPTEVKGYFYCSYNNLSTLEHSPRIVKGDFDCSWNKLISLKGAPREVGGTFKCSHNKLISLEYSPIKVGKSFKCRDNQIISLEHSPEIVGEGFDCTYNQLVTLKGAPKEIKETFSCSDNKLTSLEYAPEIVGNNFFCGNNNLTSLKGSPKKVGGWFSCIGNQLTSLEYAPEIVGENFYCYNNPLQSKELSTKVGDKVYYGFLS